MGDELDDPGNLEVEIIPRALLRGSEEAGGREVHQCGDHERALQELARVGLQVGGAKAKRRR